MLFQAWKTIKVSVMPKKTKIFVLDTNIILHDDKAIYNFQDNDIVIPITVVEELDKFKRGNDTLSYNAREFVREMDRISDNSLFAKGIPLGKGKGTVKIEIGHPFSSMSMSLYPMSIMPSSFFVLRAFVSSPWRWTISVLPARSWRLSTFWVIIVTLCVFSSS